ncbi:hypothetical protein MAR_030231 [Mya arenaria]|uniref:Uncharacterized protein n=1 Tax=Mya arenaria TaxID=6604 RepID=A0ABY7DKS0_MYAAR|nr:hypothetical protein MAR_030231 [Mya arenaria]
MLSGNNSHLTSFTCGSSQYLSISSASCPFCLSVNTFGKQLANRFKTLESNGIGTPRGTDIPSGDVSGLKAIEQPAAPDSTTTSALKTFADEPNTASEDSVSNISPVSMGDTCAVGRTLKLSGVFSKDELGDEV